MLRIHCPASKSFGGLGSLLLLSGCQSSSSFHQLGAIPKGVPSDVLAIIASAGGWLQKGVRRSRTWSLWRSELDEIEFGETHLFAIHGRAEQLAPRKQAQMGIEHAREVELIGQMSQLPGHHSVLR